MTNTNTDGKGLLDPRATDIDRLPMLREAVLSYETSSQYDHWVREGRPEPWDTWRKCLGEGHPSTSTPAPQQAETPLWFSALKAYVFVQLVGFLLLLVVWLAARIISVVPTK